MKAYCKIEKEVEINALLVEAGVRYWEDAFINGISDEKGDLTPCRKGDLWCPIIDINTGIIQDWPIGTTAEIHFKVCDNGSYYLADGLSGGIIYFSIENDYVPSILRPEEDGYGDYIIMSIDENGKIRNWKQDISSFLTNQ